MPGAVDLAARGGGDDAASLAARFNDRINDRDVDGLAELMADDHAFIDAAGGRVVGKPACLAAWRGFFGAYPDYRNHFESTASRGDVAVAIGRSTCSDPILAGPAIWAARVRDGKIVEWRVYEDTPETRAQLSIE
jgi:ketosteroid isomerase-like protein